jgi:hypothetical protein
MKKILFLFFCSFQLLSHSAWAHSHALLALFSIKDEAWYVILSSKEEPGDSKLNLVRRNLKKEVLEDDDFTFAIRLPSSLTTLYFEEIIQNTLPRYIKAGEGKRWEVRSSIFEMLLPWALLNAHIQYEIYEIGRAQTFEEAKIKMEEMSNFIKALARFFENRINDESVFVDRLEEENFYFYLKRSKDPLAVLGALIEILIGIRKGLGQLNFDDPEKNKIVLDGIHYYSSFFDQLKNFEERLMWKKENMIDGQSKKPLAISPRRPLGSSLFLEQCGM